MTDPATPLNDVLDKVHAQPGGPFIRFRKVLQMKPYPKVIHSTHGLIVDLQSKGMNIPDFSIAAEEIERIGYYRLRGYAFHFLDNRTGGFLSGTTFDSVLQLYHFNYELSSLLFAMSSKVEVALRARLCEALLSLGDPLIYLDPSIFRDKAIYWKNLGALCSEINRSDEVFIKHNHINHDGQIPIWAAVEVMSFGNLSKFVSNLIPGAGTPFSKLAKCYTYTSPKGNTIVPSLDMISSWMHSVVILRNMCAHNSRLYNRSINKRPVILASDQQTPQPRYYGLYHMLLSMKYLRPSKDEWNAFARDFEALLNKYAAHVDLAKLHLPADWKNHLTMA